MLERACQANQALIAELGPDDLRKPTPCWGWDVRALLNHMIGVNHFFAGALADNAPPLGGNTPDFVGSDAAAANAESVRTVLAAWRAPGALEKSVPFGQNQIPAALAIRLNTTDQVLHNWDLAKATGRTPRLDDELVTYAHDTLRQALRPEFRGPGRGFGYEVSVPEGASPLDRLIAFSGRQP
jgi:uncharacterized protein (TIGR03086 family)